MTDEDDLMTVREVACACQRSEETVRRWIWSGKLKARKLGNQLFVKREDMEALRTPQKAGAKSSARVAEVQEAYAPSSERWSRPSKEQIAAIMELSRAKSPKPFTPEEAEAWLARVRKLREKVVAEFGPTDVTELLRDIRGEEE